MKAKSIFNGKSTVLSHIDGLLHFIRIVTKAMTTAENGDYISTLKSKVFEEARRGEVEKVSMTALRIFKTLSAESARNFQFAGDKNMLAWNCFKYDPTVGYFVGNLNWIAPRNSGAFVFLAFTNKQANMYYYTGHTCDVFGKLTERRGGNEDLELPREHDMDLSSVPVDRFPQYIDSDLARK